MRLWPALPNPIARAAVSICQRLDHWTDRALADTRPSAKDFTGNAETPTRRSGGRVPRCFGSPFVMHYRTLFRRRGSSVLRRGGPHPRLNRFSPSCDRRGASWIMSGRRSGGLGSRQYSRRLAAVLSGAPLRVDSKFTIFDECAADGYRRHASMRLAHGEHALALAPCSDSRVGLMANPAGEFLCWLAWHGDRGLWASVR
jgi:hypothetical protein